MDAIEAADGAAAGARLALVTGLGGLVEVAAAGALQEVAASGRLVAELAGRAGEQRPGQDLVVAADVRLGGEVGIRHQRADAKTAIGGFLDLARGVGGDPPCCGTEGRSLSWYIQQTA